MTLVVLAAVAALMFAFNLYAMKKAGQMQERLEAEQKARERDKRMAQEMLKERSREDVARDLDNGDF